MRRCIWKLREHPALQDAAADWFQDKWGIPAEAYRASMDCCLAGAAPVPQWYVAADRGGIIAGAGVIENDFHVRKDLRPNLCSLYVEERCRGQGIAGAMLRCICEDMASMGVGTLYLVTDHTTFYERYGWRFLCMVQEENSSAELRLYCRHEESAKQGGGDDIA